MRALLAMLILVLASPLNAQPIPEGDEVRVREAKDAPWATGIYANSDSTSMVLTQDGLERAHQLLATERIEWKAPQKFLPRFLLTTGLGVATGLFVEWFRLIDCFAQSRECNENWGKAGAIGGVAAGGAYTLLYAVTGGKKWKDVTDHYPPAGTAH
jgi:hypothetical protein